VSLIRTERFALHLHVAAQIVPSLQPPDEVTKFFGADTGAVVFTSGEGGCIILIAVEGSAVAT
jgi:hypothetical protein